MFFSLLLAVPLPARRLWTCRYAWTTQERCPHAHSRNNKCKQQSQPDFEARSSRPLHLNSTGPWSRAWGPLQKQRRGDRTGWLGRQDSNLGMTESKSTHSAAGPVRAPSAERSKTDPPWVPIAARGYRSKLKLAFAFRRDLLQADPGSLRKGSPTRRTAEPVGGLHA